MNFNTKVSRDVFLVLFLFGGLTRYVQWTFIAFFAIFELGSLICAVATSSKILIVGRAVAGMGTAGILNGALIIIAQCVPMEKRPSTIPQKSWQ